MMTTITSIVMAFMMLMNVMSGNAFDGNSKIDEFAKHYLEENGVVGYLYNDERHYFHTSDTPWQGVLGYNDVYDSIAPFVIMFYDTVVFNFNYGGKDWRIQMWKGQYGWVFIGAEIGVYTKPETQKLPQYRAAAREDWLGLSFKLTRFGFWRQFETVHENGWWCTGFIPGSLVIMTWRGQLRMDACITVKDDTMKNALCQGIRDAGYNCSSDGLNVYVTF